MAAKKSASQTPKKKPKTIADVTPAEKAALIDRLIAQRGVWGEQLWIWCDRARQSAVDLATASRTLLRSRVRRVDHCGRSAAALIVLSAAAGAVGSTTRAMRLRRRA